MGEVRGMIFDIKRYAIHDGEGIRTTVFFKGCALRCRWCHNPESYRKEAEAALRPMRCVGCLRCVEACGHGAISEVEGRAVTDFAKCVVCGECVEVCATGAREIVGREVGVDEVMREIEKDVVFYDETGGGATFSGGEPLMQGEFLCELLRGCAEAGIGTLVDTSCYAEWEVVERASGLAGGFLCDIKHMDSEIHRQFTGVGNETILENIRRLAKAGRKIVLRMPVIAGVNDDDRNVEAVGRFAAGLNGGVERVELLVYNRGGWEKSRRMGGRYDVMDGEGVSAERMEAIAERLRGAGLDVRIGG
jgi:pyruvate formate lyase activating enzyme